MKKNSGSYRFILSVMAIITFLSSAFIVEAEVVMLDGQLDFQNEGIHKYGQAMLNGGWNFYLKDVFRDISSPQIVSVLDFFQWKSEIGDAKLFGAKERFKRIRENCILLHVFMVGSIFIIALFHVAILLYFFTQSLYRGSLSVFQNGEKHSGELKALNLSIERKVESRTNELLTANMRLQRVEESRRKLLASVSHELNTPLTFIQGSIKAMMDGVISKDDSTYLRAIYSDTQMMTRLIGDLQELSKLESGHVSLQVEPVDIRAFLIKLYEEQKPIVQCMGYHFHYIDRTIEKGNFELICTMDKLRIKQVLMNFITNAQKFTPRGGTITMMIEICISPDACEVKISIIDTGQGIAEKDVQRIFDRFYKTNQTEDSMGLGLAITKEIIIQHKGMIGVASEESKGSTFFFSLPVYSSKKTKGGLQYGEQKGISRG